MYRHGWYQIAFDREITLPVSPSAIGARRLVVLRGSEGLRVADATCPHRGADLGFGGSYDGRAIVCPFHGFRIGLGGPSDQGFCVREYRTLVVGGLVFVQLSGEHDNGFAAFMEKLAATSLLIPGFSLRVRAQAEMVIENAFDQAHFAPVHSIDTRGAFSMRPSDNGELVSAGTFELPPSLWQRRQVESQDSRVPFLARAFSPGVIVSDLGGAHPYSIVTAATPTGDSECVIRLSVALPPAEDGSQPRKDLIDFLLRRSRAGLDRDRVIWEHLSPGSPSRYTALDKPVLEFKEFCSRFIETVPV
jgi:phenylpropionate dioxygenase-like ring-hydroxylating dioxygenase large terminal subunit